MGWSLAGAAAPARAIDLWDGRIELHGFYETRLSFGMEDFDPSKQVDMYGWLHVVNLEADVGIAPNGWGPFDLVSAFTRVEVKYDCVWSHACGIFESVDAFGNHPEKLPHRAQQSRRQGIAASQNTFDQRPYWFDDRTRLTPGLFADADANRRGATSIVYGYTAVGLFGASTGPDGQLGEINDIYDGDPLSGLPGDDDAGLYLFQRAYPCKSGTWNRRDSSPRGYQTRELPWSIEGCYIQPIGFNRHVADPFRDFASTGAGGDVNPVLLAVGDADGIPDRTAMPLRPGSENPAGPDPGNAPWESQGIFLPNARVRDMIRNDKFDDYNQNFTLDELRWNRGASQETWKELRELYFDIEMLDSRLWLRAGKQTIVWGKTELFRNQDQWNPVDIAIGPLASLEESRIALWALRAVWSFYEVQPFQDVRFELVTLYDKFEPTDVGRCGEAYVPRLACDKAFGLWVHGQNGSGIAGEVQPEHPWNDAEGVEVGGRLEFRWERFSFALSDYWGYNDTPYQSILFQYSRNVDPETGRPRHTEATGPCGTGNPALEPDCLAPGHPLGDVVAIHSINQSMFHWVCAGTVGVAPQVDPAACAFTLFNSQLAPLGAPFAGVFSSIVAGTGAGTLRLNVLLGETPFTPEPGLGTPIIQGVLLSQFGAGGTNTLFYQGVPSVSPLVPLVYDGAGDGLAPTPATAQRFGSYTTEQQAALWGCGNFYLVDCDGLNHPGPNGIAGDADDTLIGGFDLANAEASVMLQSFPWFEGTLFDNAWRTTDASLPQPGTVDAVLQGYGADIPSDVAAGRGIGPGDVGTGPVGTRFEDGRLWILPGAHYDGDVLGAIATAAGLTLSPYLQQHVDEYDRAIDGSVRCTVPGPACREIVPGSGIFALAHPFTGQIWAGEMSIASFNLLMLAAGLGAENSDPDGVPGSGDEAIVSLATLDRSQPLALGRCSLAQPQFCNLVSGLASQSRLTSSRVAAGANGRFGRRNFVWQTVGDLALRYQKRNILGFSMDFAEDTTKSSWGVEFTWVDDSLTADNGQYDGLSAVDEFNLTLSVDRPSFVNFLNANRTFLINTQLFTSYISGYREAMLREGPWTFLWLLNVSTGYFQDRFLPSAVLVWDFRSHSGAFLPNVQYRLTENLSVTVGASVFTGRFSEREMGINQFAAFDEDNLSDTVYVENGISPVRDLDSFFARIRYTF